MTTTAWFDVAPRTVISDTTGGAGPDILGVSRWGGYGNSTNFATAREVGTDGGDGIGATGHAAGSDVIYEVYQDVLTLHWNPFRSTLEGFTAFVDWSLAPAEATGVEFEPFRGSDFGVPAGDYFLSWPGITGWITGFNVHLGYGAVGSITRDGDHAGVALAYSSPTDAQSTVWLPASHMLDTGFARFSTPIPSTASTVEFDLDLSGTYIGVDFSSPDDDTWSVIVFTTDLQVSGGDLATLSSDLYGLRMTTDGVVVVTIHWQPPRYRFVLPDAAELWAHVEGPIAAGTEIWG